MQSDTNVVCDAIRRGDPEDELQTLIDIMSAQLRQRDCDGNFPLHVAVKGKSTLQVVRLLLDGWKGALQEKDLLGKVPLHLAAGWNSSLDVVKLLHMEFPEAIQKRDDLFGNLPLHKAAKWNPSIDVTTYLYEAWPEAIQAEDNFKRLPLHKAARWNRSLKVVKLLYQKRWESIKAVDNKGYLPLHFAAASNSLRVVQFLHGRWPEASFVCSANGELPVDCARKNHNWEAVAWLENWIRSFVAAELECLPADSSADAQGILALPASIAAGPEPNERDVLCGRGGTRPGKALVGRCPKLVH
jgi:hypothetical protein